jgi:hypothetical protein
VPIEEPRPPAGFQVLLGALTLGRPEPVEAWDPVKPGPEVPFLIPALLKLPAMQAVIARVDLPNGDVAWPVSYWSTEELDPKTLHQPWLRDMWWFDLGDGKAGWSIATDPWDFELVKWAAAGKLGWVDLTSPEPTLVRKDLEFLEKLPGERRPQLYADGERSFLELPNGARAVPFGEPDDGPPAKLTPEEEAALDWEDEAPK